MKTALSPRIVASKLRRQGLDEWAFVRFCSRADRCSVNRCPLNPLIELRAGEPLDRETKCPTSKPDRERFVSRMTPEMRSLLPFGGLFESEWHRREAGRRRDASLTPEERTSRLESLRACRARAVEARLYRLSITTGTGAGSDTSPTVSHARAGGVSA